MSGGLPARVKRLWGGWGGQSWQVQQESQAVRRQLTSGTVHWHRVGLVREGQTAVVTEEGPRFARRQDAESGACRARVRWSRRCRQGDRPEGGPGAQGDPRGRTETLGLRLRGVCPCRTWLGGPRDQALSRLPGCEQRAARRGP